MSLNTKLSLWVCFLSIGLWFGGLWLVHELVAR